MLRIDLVAPDIYRGAQPTTPDDWQQLKNLGVKYVLDLETGAHLLFDGSPLLEQVTAQALYGIRAWAHPLGEILPPTKDELDLALAVIFANKPIYIHCKKGVDRTGMVCGRLRIALGWSREKAIQEMRELGMHWWYYFWTWFL